MEGVGAAAGSDDGRAGVAEKLSQRRRDPLVILDQQHLHGADARNPSPKRSTVFDEFAFTGVEFERLPLQVRAP